MESDQKKTEREWARDDVVQIGPDPNIKPPFHGKFAVIEEVVGWGLMVRIEVFEGDAYLRLPWAADFAFVGKAVYVRQEEVGNDDSAG